MSVDITNKTKAKINTKIIKGVSEKFLKKYKKENLDLSVVIVGDKRIRKINNIYRGYDKVTDILSFEGEDESFGELIINYGKIKKQAKAFNNTHKEELVFILVHGLFHLLGYSDESEDGEDEMIRMGNDFIKNLKL